MNTFLTKQKKVYNPIPIKKIIENGYLAYRKPQFLTNDECYEIENYIYEKYELFKPNKIKYINLKNDKLAYEFMIRLYNKLPKTIGSSYTFTFIYPIFTIYKQNPKLYDTKFIPKIKIKDNYVVKFIGMIHLTDLSDLIKSDVYFYKKDSKGIDRAFTDIKSYNGSLIIYDNEEFTTRQSLINDEQLILYFYCIYKKNNLTITE